MGTGDDPATVFYCRMPLRSPLSSIPIPLRRRDPEISLDLQTHIHSAYVDGRYAKRLDHALPLDPPLAREDLAWPQSFTKSHS